MKLTISKDTAKADGVIFPAFDDIDLSKPIPGLSADLLKAVKEAVKVLDWKWKANQTKTLLLTGKKLVLLGLGKRDKFTTDKYRKSFGKAARNARDLKAKVVAVALAQLEPLTVENLRLVCENLVDGLYSFQNYKSEKDTCSVEQFLLIPAKDSKKLATALDEGLILAEALRLTRDLTNEPANYMTPIQLGEEAKNAGKQYGFAVQVYDEKKIQQLKMEAFWSVAKGSDNPPRLIVMRYQGNPDKPKEILGLVGKGLTYDSGGYALKPADGMASMKNDMGGGAAVIGAICAIAAMKMKVNVTAVVAACENMVSGHAYKNGDVIGSMAGKTIEVNNTDAEGRLTLADAVYYAITKEKVTRLADIATLTGAAVIALGPVRIGLVDNDDKLYQTLSDAADTTGERIWRLPHDDDYLEQLHSDIADLRNTGGRPAGTVTAGLFIREFVKDIPWLHLDIACTAFNDKEGATGSGVRILAELARQLTK